MIHVFLLSMSSVILNHQIRGSKVYLSLLQLKYAKSFTTRQFMSSEMNEDHQYLNQCLLLPSIAILFPEQQLDQLEGHWNQFHRCFVPHGIMPPRIPMALETPQQLPKLVPHMV